MHFKFKLEISRNLWIEKLISSRTSMSDVASKRNLLETPQCQGEHTGSHRRAAQPRVTDSSSPSSHLHNQWRKFPHFNCNSQPPDRQQTKLQISSWRDAKQCDGSRKKSTTSACNNSTSQWASASVSTSQNTSVPQQEDTTAQYVMILSNEVCMKSALPSGTPSPAALPWGSPSNSSICNF